MKDAHRRNIRSLRSTKPNLGASLEQEHEQGRCDLVAHGVGVSPPFAQVVAHFKREISVCAFKQQRAAESRGLIDEEGGGECSDRTRRAFAETRENLSAPGDGFIPSDTVTPETNEVPGPQRALRVHGDECSIQQAKPRTLGRVVGILVGTITELPRDQPGGVREQLGPGASMTEVADDGCERVRPSPQRPPKHLAEVHTARLIGIRDHHPSGAILGQVQGLDGREPGARLDAGSVHAQRSPMTASLTRAQRRRLSACAANEPFPASSSSVACASSSTPLAQGVIIDAPLLGQTDPLRFDAMPDHGLAAEAS
jgi:hypothetical protein